MKEEVPNSIEINCDAIDFDDDLPLVKSELIDSVDSKTEPVTKNVTNNENNTPNVEDLHDDISNDISDSPNFVDCNKGSDSDEDKNGSRIEEELIVVPERNSKITSVIASAIRAPRQSRQIRKKKRDSSRAENLRKMSENSSTKNGASETDFQVASKYMRMNCEVCDHPFETLALAKSHSQLTHNSTARFTCCDRRLRIYNINDHLQYHLNPDVFK